MALKSNREGLRRELVDYLGNIIVDGKLKQDIIDANSIDLLWENASPSSTFVSQSISLDLSSYKAVYITFMASNREPSLKILFRSCICVKNTTNNAPSFPDAQYSRDFSVSNSGITFGESWYYATYTSVTKTFLNDLSIPVKIYGIK